VHRFWSRPHNSFAKVTIIMAIRNYAVLKGTPVDGRIFPPHSSRDQPHFHIHVKTASGEEHDIAVNIQSSDGSEVLYLVNENFSPANAPKLVALKDGVTHPDHDGTLALDFVRVPGLVTREQMTLLPLDETSPSSALHSKIDTLVQKAIQQKATIYAFGQTFRNGTNSSNPFWGFKPDQGIHDIHMNQGNPPGPHARDNGTFQDGALIISFADGTWAAIFIAFQSQSFKTDENGDQVS
jgi:uncharacterized protein YukJ